MSDETYVETQKTSPLIKPMLKKILIAVISVMVIAALGAGGYYGYKEYKKHEDNKKPGDSKCADGHRSCNGKCCASTYQDVNGVCSCGCANEQKSCTTSYNGEPHTWCCPFSGTCSTTPGSCS